MADITLALARHANALSLVNAPPAVRHWARLAIADTIGVMLAGSHEGVVDLLCETIEPSHAASGSLLLGRAMRVGVLEAALINGVSAHALDFDDCSLTLDGHPSVPMVPALLALAERLDCHGDQLLAAYVAGFETETRLALVLNPAHVERGWHPTATLGIFGTAVACGRLLQLDDEAMAVAIAIAASSASGLRANSGTMTKPLHAGQANRNGLLAALLARNGFTANVRALEHGMGFFHAFHGAGVSDMRPLLEGWGERWELLDPGVAIKQFPCCAFVHSAIAAATELRDDLAGGTDDIARIDIHLHRRRLKNIDRPDPKSELDAKFSTHYVTACALEQGSVRFEDFEPGAYDRARLRAVMGRSELLAHDEDDVSAGRVTITLRDGGQRSARASVAMGRGPLNPMSEAEFAGKFHDCAGRVLEPDATERLLDALLSLDGSSRLRSLLTTIEAAAPSRERAPALRIPA